MIHQEVAAMLLSLCMQLTLAGCPALVDSPEVLKHHSPYETITPSATIMMFAVTQNRITKEKKYYVYYSQASIKGLNRMEIRGILVHELAHYVLYVEKGLDTSKHQRPFRTECRMLAKLAGGVRTSVCRP